MNPRLLVPVAAIAALAAACHGSRGGAAALGGLAVSHAVVPVPSSSSEASAFLVIENHGGTSVTLTGATSPEAASVRLSRDIGGQMEPVDGVEIPAAGRTRLVPGSYHLMLQGLSRRLALGDTVTLRLTFSPSGEVTVRAPLLTYTDAISDLPMR